MIIEIPYRYTGSSSTVVSAYSSNRENIEWFASGSCMREN
jgi:hypothetical protein